MGTTIITVAISTTVSLIVGAVVGGLIAATKSKIKEPKAFREHTEAQFSEFDRRFDSIEEKMDGMSESITNNIIETITERNQVIQEHFRNSDNALLCLTRKSLIHECEKYLGRGKITVYAKDNIVKMYDAYHNLGGNGTITTLYEKTMNLPIIEDDE